MWKLLKVRNRWKLKSSEREMDPTKTKIKLLKASIFLLINQFPMTLLSYMIKGSTKLHIETEVETRSLTDEEKTF